MISDLSGTELNHIKSTWRAYSSSETLPSGQDLSLGLAATFTIEPLIPYLGVSLLEAGFSPVISTAPYNQIHQVCLDPSAAFDGVTHSCICLFWRIEDLLLSDLDAWCQGDNAALDRVNDQLNELASLIGGLAKNYDGQLVVSTPPFPTLPEVAITDLNNTHRVGRFHHHVVGSWTDLLSQMQTVRILDLDGLQRHFGMAQSTDTRKWYLYKQPFTESFIASIASQLGRILHSLHFPTKKCVAVDCDNTLWGGIVGEDGLSGIQLGHDFPGSAFRDFQKVLLHWKKQGVLIAILSKNNEDEVWEVFNKHDGMLLKKSDIVAWRIDWNSKPENLVELATELNIGVDSFVFIDDNAFEIEQMRGAYPTDVDCFQLPAEASNIVTQLKTKHWFEKTIVSEEDKTRTEMLVSERNRRPLQQSLTHEEFVASLQIEIDLFEIQPEHIGRVTQLINKTNQFNLSTRRRTENEVRKLVQSSDHIVFATRIEDRFGDYGISGVVIIRKDKDSWMIDTFLLSCRVLGRQVESAIMATLAEYAQTQGVTTLRADYIPTSKNKPVETFLPSHGFTQRDGEYTLSEENFPSHSEFITIKLAK